MPLPQWPYCGSGIAQPRTAQPWIAQWDCTATDCTATDCTAGLYSHGLHSRACSGQPLRGISGALSPEGPSGMSPGSGGQGVTELLAARAFWMSCKRCVLFFPARGARRKADSDKLLARALPSFIFQRSLSEWRSASPCQVLLQIEKELICSRLLSVVAGWN